MAKASRRVHVRAPKPYDSSSAGRDDTRKFQSKLYNTSDIIFDRKERQDNLANNLIGLNPQTIHTIAAMRGEELPSQADDAVPMDFDDLGETAVGGDEDGWEDVERNEIDVRDLMRIGAHRRYHDKRSWGERIRRLEANWQAALPDIIYAYLRWRYPPPVPHNSPQSSSQRDPESSRTADPEPSPESSPETPSSPTPTVNQHSATEPTAAELESFDIEVLDLFTLSETVTIPFGDAKTRVEALAQNGYLAVTPSRPTLAISFTTLELMRRIRLFKASFSTEAFTKVLCYYYSMPYIRTVRNSVADAFEIYLAIQRVVKKRVLLVLGRDAPDWRAKNSCPACSYELVGEPPQVFSRMYCMDGNSSLKRMRPVGGRKVGDAHVFNDSDYYLPNDFVDKYADEVRVRPPRHLEGAESNSEHPNNLGGIIGDSEAGGEALEMRDPCANAPSEGSIHHAPVNSEEPVPSPNPAASTPTFSSLPPMPTLGPAPSDSIPPDHEAVAPPSSTTVEGDPTDGDPDSTCTKNWKAAQADEKKKSWDIFEENGVFVSACPHGFILWIIDMVRSGEVAKLPLATVAKAIQTFGRRTLAAYDVGCSLVKTIHNSSLAEAFKETGSQVCVPSFHGYSHEYSCQVKFHPINITGTGLEDFETMERLFSWSNQLAPLIRYSSAYHRRLFIDLFAQQWDDEKYANLARMLYDNFRQALKIIDETGVAVAQALEAQHLSPEDLVRFAQEERTFLATLGKEDAKDLRHVAYVEALQEIRSISEKLQVTTRAFMGTTFAPTQSGPIDYAGETSKTRRLETNRRYLDERRKMLLLDIIQMERGLGIDSESRWQPSDPDYARTVEYINNRKYHVAVAHLQRLVVQRLFELHKMNLAQTGYKLRQQIAKNLQKRSRAIRNAINAYNEAARALKEPRPTLEWGKVSHYHFLQQFELLQGVDEGVLEKEWAQPAVRETMRQARRVVRAHEELERVNIQSRRLLTSIRDEDCLFADVLTQLRQQGDIIYGTALEFATRRRRVNACLLVTLRKLHAHSRFTGEMTAGLRVGTTPPPNPSVDMDNMVGKVMGTLDEDDDHLGGEDDDEEVQAEMTALTDFVAGLRM